MNGKVSCLRVLIGFLVLLMAVPPWVLAQGPGAGASFREEELDQMLAPIALYPDSLLGQILVAATYPDQVKEADQWVRDNSSLRGDALNDALDRMDWDLSVKALVPFPQVLAMMSDKMDWTQRMGDAFLAQQADVMDTVQRLRAKAHAQGNLKDTEQQRVVVRGESIEIEPANPQVIYVPTYNPAVIYGSWWYPAYPPYAYNPYYPGYAWNPYYTGAGFVTAGLFGFAAGVAVGSVWNSGWGHWNWSRHDVNVNINRHININRNNIRRTDIRTSSWHNVNRNRVSRESGRHAVGQAGTKRTAVKPGTRPSAESVSKGLKQREGKAQVREGKKAGQGTQTKMGSERGQKGSKMSSERSKGQRGSKMSSERSKGQRGSKMSSGKSRGESLRSGGSNRGGNARGGGGNARGGANKSRSGGGGAKDRRK